MSKYLTFSGCVVENFPFWGMEWELPIETVDGKRDYEAIQRAWWVNAPHGWVNG